MEKVKALNLKNMKETIVNFSRNQKEFDMVWNAFRQMAWLGFIESEVWEKFVVQCVGWYVDEENGCVRDERNCPQGVDSIVGEYTQYVEYKAGRK